ncbi:MAG: hypothetical protein EOS28_06230 [Mesorhizobium sp.]|nr:MAG: hypothetical protein EOS28_06230 [Mesorhizobium sp.]
MEPRAKEQENLSRLERAAQQTADASRQASLDTRTCASNPPHSFVSTWRASPTQAEPMIYNRPQGTLLPPI